jgi:hypothetical protein
MVTISGFVNDILRREYGVRGFVIPCPVDTSKFSPAENKKINPPRILCTAALTQERKRIPLLVKAFERLTESCPDAILQLAGETNPEITKRLLSSVNSKARRAIETLDITSDEALASVYRNATISVIPSLMEPFGMVTTESLASGTPVVGTRSGGIPEILDDPRVGVLFEPSDGPDELSEALRKGLELAQDPQTSERCRQHAERYAWDRLGPQYEGLYPEILNGSSGRLRQPWKEARNKGGLSSWMSGLSRVSGSRPSRRSFNRIFDDTLDDLEIPYHVYYQIDSDRPRCLSILTWLWAKGFRKGSVLVLSPSPHFLSTLLSKLGFSSKGIMVTQSVRIREDLGGFQVLSDLQELDGIEGNCDVIICDDLLQHLQAPGKTFQILQGHLRTGGLLILTGPHFTRGEFPVRKLCLGSFHLPLEEEAERSVLPDARNAHSESLPGYTLGEVADLLSKAAFELIEKRYIVGKKSIHNRITAEPVPVWVYLRRKTYDVIQKVRAPLRSHIFVVARRPQGDPG